MIALKSSRLIVLAAILFTSINISFAQTNDCEKTLTQFLSSAGYKTIPLQKYPTGHLYTEVNINGAKGRFILDTGAGTTVVEEKRKEKFKMISVQTHEKATGAGSSDMKLLSSESNKLILSSYSIDNFTVMLMNLDHVNSALKQLGFEEVDGVIGADLLKQGEAVIDYANMILYLKQ
jgi:hypothetical protein